jgi:diguanylate cyclase (GGDEF)-like protein
VRAATSADVRWGALTGRPVYDSYRNFCGFRGHGTDLTEKRRSEQQVSRLALHDSLTGLANRVQMSQALAQILAAPSGRERECAALMLDLDRFKHVNDTLGHPAGDALLRQVAQRLERAIGTAGRCGRLGGDEFQVIVPGHQRREMLGHLAKEIITQLSQPYTIEGQSVVIGASVGIALAPEHGAASDELIRMSTWRSMPPRMPGAGSVASISRISTPPPRSAPIWAKTYARPSPAASLTFITSRRFMPPTRRSLASRG